MKKVKIMLLAVLLAALVVPLFAGGQKEATAAGAKKLEGKKISVLYMSSTYADAARDLAVKFEKDTGCKVEVVDFPYITLYEKMGLDLSTNSGSYDMVQIACQWDGEFEPYLEDLDPYIKKDKWDSSDIIESVWDQSGKWNNKIMGIPMTNTPYLLSYRTDLVQKVPDTWDEFFKICEKLNDPAKGFYAIAVPGVKEQFDSIFMIAHWALGGAWADSNWNVTINSPETRKALDISKKTLQYSDPAAPAWGLPEADAAFLQGKAAFCFSWPTLGVTVVGDDPAKSKVVGKWALAQFPKEKTGLTNLSSWDLGIPKAAKNKDAAWEWIKAYTALDHQLEIFQKYTILSPRKSFWNTDIVKNSKLAPHATAKAIMWWRIPAGTMCETYVRDAVANYVTGQWDKEKAVTYMEENFKKTLKEYPPAPGIKNTGR
ncbi:MAG TPA: extracellular solute-binding protein [Spirochaetia bacterium]|nr:extracellular solute-binding protein [Spirochaetia bacterium]